MLLVPQHVRWAGARCAPGWHERRETGRDQQEQRGHDETGHVERRNPEQNGLQSLHGEHGQHEPCDDTDARQLERFAHDRANQAGYGRAKR